MITNKKILGSLFLLSMYIVDVQGQTVVSIAGSRTASGFLDASGTSARFSAPSEVAIDASGNNIYVSDVFNNSIRKVTSAGIVSTVAGSSVPGSADGSGTAASFNVPFGTAVDGDGNVYVVDGGNNKIRKITSIGYVGTFAGSGLQGSSDGTGTAASFNHPAKITVDGSGNLYVTDRDNHKIRKITATGIVTTLAGSGVAGNADGTGTAASFNTPLGIAVDAAGNVYVADALSYKIRKISSTGLVTTLAGASTAGFLDGTGSGAKFSGPVDVAVDNLSGNIYVLDAGFVRRITPAGVVTTLSLASNYNGSLTGIDIDASGNIYLSASHEILKITPFPDIDIQENEISLTDGGSFSFGSTLQGTSVTKTFVISNKGTATLNLGVLATLPSGFTLTGVFPTGSLIPGNTASFQIELDATNTGNLSGTLSFASDDPEENPFALTISGTIVVPAPEISVEENNVPIADGGSLGFGSTLQGTSVTKLVTIHNTGSIPLTLTLPADITGFTVGNFPASIVAGDHATFDVTMNASSIGTVGGTISFVNNDSDENPFDIIISGTVVAPVPEISVKENNATIADGGFLNFGITTLGHPVLKTITIYNTGTATLTLTAPSSVAGLTIAGFPSSIPAGSSADFTVSMNASFINELSGTISFTSNDPVANPFDITVTGAVSISSAVEDVQKMEQSLLVFPNSISAGQEITIQSSTATIDTIELFDQYGKKLCAIEFQDHPTLIIYHVPGHLSSGIYFLRIKNTLQKLVVTN